MHFKHSATDQVASDPDLFDLDRGEKSRRGHRFDSRVGDDAEDENRNDVKRCIFVPRRSERAPAHIGHRGDAARRRIALGIVDFFDSAFRIAIIERDEPLHLLLRIANQASADLGFAGYLGARGYLGYSGRAGQQEQGQRERCNA
jgi:hypothetical protein